MKHTLIAVFDSRTDAQGAMDELLLSGFTGTDVRLSEDTASIADTEVSDRTEEQGIGASIIHFFTDLFGSDRDVHGNKYATAVSKGHHVLTVTTADEPEAERAADIVERFGPVDIDDKVAEWSGAPLTASGQAMRMASPGSMQRSERTTLHFQGDRGLFAQQSLNDERPMGHTYQESMGPGDELSTGYFGGVQRGGSRIFSPLTPGQANIIDTETYNRSHWDSTYGAGGRSYDDYEPAYSFGHEMATMYRDRPWDEAEPDVRNKWESRDTAGGASTWEEFKAAIRHGWDRLTH
ncbi:hypothetical protein HHL21_03235 [Massilia sp. RP-1-19]|uniref:Uncharacterized protein n=1 Tax=Massilia polaris TaxID=2728846 RepID=A0A848HFX7_9BURK|nr:hypothetical protein [Massilia polaris]NML60114.1 hypothetical protein [Massilia polaris]